MTNFLSDLFMPILNNLETIVRHGGYTVLFFISLLEGIPVIGQFVPGHTIVIFSGFLVKLNILNGYFVVPLVILGAMLGDLAGFLLGKKYGFNFLKIFGKYVFINEQHIEKAKKLIHNHTGKTIIVGRLSPFTRPLTPFIVGASDIHIKKFWLLDFLGVVIWSVGSIAIGYIFGASYHIVAGVLGKFIVVAIILSVLIIWGYHFINKQLHIFAKYELITLGLNISALYIFFKTVQDALSVNSFMTGIDVWMNLFISSRITAPGLVIMNVITDVLSPEILLSATLLCLVYLLYKKQWRYSVITVLSTGGGLVIGSFIKELIMRDRPLNRIILETGYSFPSNHAVAATVFFTLIIYFFAKRIKSLLYREIIILVSVLLVILTAFSRLYVGVHWFSDTIAGISLGLFWTTLVILMVRYLSMLVERFRKAD